jgi:uncharacterized protein related to proFAR isomerase
MNNNLKLSENTIVRINNNKAEIIVDNEYKLMIIVENDKVIARYSNVSLIIEYNKLDAEKIAKKIFQIVKQTHRFSVLTIRKALQLLILDRFISEVIGTERGENTELLKQVIELLSKS